MLILDLTSNVDIMTSKNIVVILSFWFTQTFTEEICVLFHVLYI